MRLDKYLKVSRIIKRRTVANDACDASRVKVNGRDVKPGDEIEISLGQRTVRLRVREVRDNVGKDEASSLYEII